MKTLALVAGILLGLLFIAASVVYFLKLVDAPPPPEGSPMASFFAAMYPTRYLDFVKALELLGGVLVAIPATRRAGLLVLGPIIVNILAAHVFLMKGEGLTNPMLIAIVVLTLVLVAAERRAFAAFLRGRSSVVNRPG
jgi:putative oxidoreductase